eukprot:3795695-Rhodomonas_salina.3
MERWDVQFMDCRASIPWNSGAFSSWTAGRPFHEERGRPERGGSRAAGSTRLKWRPGSTAHRQFSTRPSKLLRDPALGAYGPAARR